MTVQAGLCWTWLETKVAGFLTKGSIIIIIRGIYVVFLCQNAHPMSLHKISRPLSSGEVINPYACAIPRYMGILSDTFKE